MQTRWLTDAEMRAWRNFVELAHEIEFVTDGDLAQFGLNGGDYQVLVVLSEAADHRMRMCDLALMLRLTPSGLTRRLDGLVGSGVILRVPSEVDRRVTLAVLSDKGFALLRNAAPSHVDSVRRNFIDLLSADQIEALGDALGTVRAIRAEQLSDALRATVA